MNNFQYVVNSTVMDLYPDGSNPKLRRRVSDLQNPSNRQLDNTFELEIPKTAKNLITLGLTDTMASFGIFQTPENSSLLTFNSVVIMNGISEVTSLDEDSIFVVVYSKVVEVADALKDKMLSDLSFPLTYWDYENTIRDWCNHDYTVDSIVNPIPPFTSAQQILGDYSSTGTFYWILGENPRIQITSASTSGATLGSNKLQLRFRPTINQAYTFNYTLSTVTETGNYQVWFAFFNNNTMVRRTFANVAAGTMSSSFTLTAPSFCNYLTIYLTGVGASCALTLQSLTQTSPVPSQEVTHKFPFIMYERAYTPKYVIDSWFRGPGPGFVAGSETSNGLDYQRAQFLILNDIQGNTSHGDVSNFPVNFWEYGQFPAAMYLVKVIKKMFNDAGWNVGGSLLQDAEFKKLLVIATGDGKMWKSAVVTTFDPAEAANDLFEAHRTSAQQANVQTGTVSAPPLPAAITWQPILFDFEDSDPNARYNPANGKYTFGANYRAQFTAHILGHVQLVNDPTATATWRIYSSVKGVIAQTSYKARSGPFFSYDIDFLLQTTPMDFSTGEEVWVQQACYGNGFTNGFMTTRTDSNYYNTIVGGDVNDVPMFNVKAFLPKFKQLDFLKQTVIIPFNAFLYVDDDNKTVYLESYDKFILPNNQAIDISSQLVDLNFKSESIDKEDRSIQIIFDENEDDDVPFMPNQYKYPDDYSEMVRIRQKELTIGRKIYSNNEIFNYDQGIKEVNSQLAPTNFRKFTLVNTRDFKGTTVSTNYPFEIMLPVVSTYDDMTKEWFSEDDGIDARPFASENSFGNGFRLLKDDGAGQWVNYLDGTGYDVYYVYLGDPGHYSTAGRGEAMRYRCKINLTSYLDNNTVLLDDSFNEYFYTGFWSKKESPLNLSAASFYTYSDSNDPTKPKKGWQTNDNGTLNQVRNDLYTLHYEPKYANMEYSDLLSTNVYMTELDWNNWQANVPLIAYGVEFTLEEISSYQPFDGLAQIKLLKRV